MFALDTDAVSGLRRPKTGKADRNVQAWATSVRADDLFVSAITILDALIAATALVHRMAVVTRNGSDFASTGVSLLNPWDPVARQGEPSKS